MSEALTRLPDELHAFLQAPRITQIATVDLETGGPFVNVISWVLAVQPDAVRLMGDTRTRFMQNLRADPRVALTVLGAGSAWTIYGNARLLAEKTPGLPLSLALVELVDLRIYPSLFWGAVLTQEPRWDVTYSREEADKFDTAVFTAMRQFVAE